MLTTIIRTTIWTLAVVGLILFVLWRRGWLDSPPAPPRPLTDEELLKKAEMDLSLQDRECLIRLAADDGNNAKQYKYIAYAAINLNQEKKRPGICAIFDNKLTLAAPLHEAEMHGRFWKRAWTGDRVPAATIEIMRIFNHPENQEADFKQEPCLQEITRYFRVPKLLTNQDKSAMDDELKILHRDLEDGVTYYGPKDATKTCPDVVKK